MGYRGLTKGYRELQGAIGITKGKIGIRRLQGCTGGYKT